MNSKLMDEKIINGNEKNLSVLATKDSDYIRIKDGKKSEEKKYPFFYDANEILQLLSYTRYIDKTQVFTEAGNDNVTKRVLHVQLVSKIGRTIGRYLNLNEDLIEAIALGHDVGHVPFGHVGESILNKISLANNEGYFMHNVQSVRNFMVLENNGQGVDLSVQVLDGILCHNGEIIEGIYLPVNKTKQQFLDEYNSCYVDKNVSLKLAPMTLEGCVVRISDVVAYIGRDFEDAITLGILKRDDLPHHIKEVLGNTNSEIVTTIVDDIISNSYEKNYIKMSKKVYEALEEFKKFNYTNIYNKAHTPDDINEYEKMFNGLFKFYLDNFEGSNDLHDKFLISMSDEYKNNNTKARIIIDYIAGMTDNYFIKKYRENIERK